MDNGSAMDGFQVHSQGFGEKFFVSENLLEVWSDGGLVFKVEGKIEELQDGGDEWFARKS